MTAGATPILGLVTADAGDVLPEAITKANWTTIDSYVVAYQLTNKSGLSVAANSVVIADTTTDSAFTTTASAGVRTVVGVTQATIANNAAGVIRSVGMSSVLVTGATSRGDWLTTSTTAGKALATTSTTPPAGAFAIALSSTVGAGTVTAYLLGATTPSAFSVTTGAGAVATAIAPVAYDTTSLTLQVWNGSASVPATPFYDSERVAFRSNRHLVALYSAQANNTAGTGSAVGIGFFQTPVDSNDVVTVVGTEPVFKISTSTAGNGYLSGPFGGGGISAGVSPSHSLRMMVRVVLPAASANVSFWLCGFVSAFSATPNGAYLRITTTGNVFFVTRQGTETTTDLGVLARTSTVLGFEIETVDAGVTWVCRNQAGTVLATHVATVPTAATGLTYLIGGTTATGAVPHGVAFAVVEGTFA